jgi:hypothetical protein
MIILRRLVVFRLVSDLLMSRNSAEPMGQVPDVPDLPSWRRRRLGRSGTCPISIRKYPVTSGDRSLAFHLRARIKLLFFSGHTMPSASNGIVGMMLQNPFLNQIAEFVSLV